MENKPEENEDVAITLANEAGGDGYMAMIAVACVIANRCRARNQTAYDVVHAPKQFSCWTELTPEQRQKNYLAVKEDADKIAAELFSHYDITHGAQNYLTNKLYNSIDCPGWAYDMVVTVVIVNQTFLKPAGAMDA